MRQPSCSSVLRPPALPATTGAHRAQQFRASRNADFPPATLRQVELRARPRRPAIPASRHLLVCKRSSGSARRPAPADCTLPMPTGPGICTSARSRSCCQSNEPEPPPSAPDERRCGRSPASDRVQPRLAGKRCCGGRAQPRSCRRSASQRRQYQQQTAARTGERIAVPISYARDFRRACRSALSG